ncbi:prolipoprotein diacylglyceryl transferase [Parvibaculaceae bacterium PLY_AMNH_Bact1]|nr:prolipoprotein diacylglyceryl transferase [Parvibaculaceae bacterium PLY_AMNH_Bact1]
MQSPRETLTSHILTAERVPVPFPEIDPVLIQVGPFAIRWYALAYIAGLLLGWRYLMRLADTPTIWGRKSPFTRDQADDLLLWVALGVILGGRLGYVLFYNPVFYLYNPGDIIAVWNGGMSFHGGFLGVVLAIYLFSRKHTIPLWSLADGAAAVAPIGILFGRLANFINSELWGRTTDVAWGVVFPTGGPLPRHPSQLYEGLLEGVLLFIVLRYLTHHTNALSRPGIVAGTFFIGYGLSRIFVEFFREPDAHIGYLFGPVTQGMVLTVPMILVGAGIIWWAQTKSQTPQSNPARKQK